MSGVALVLASAALYTLLFPPLALRPLAAVALVPFFAAAAGAGAARAAGLGLLWAAAATIGVTWWMPRMLHAFFDVPLAAGAGWLLALGVLAIGPAYAAFAGWLAWSARRGAPSPWSIGAAWLAAEWLRSHGPVGSPWAMVGYAAVGTPFAQAADLAGPAAPGYAIAVANAALAGLAVPVLRGPHARGHAAGALLLVIALLGYGALRLGHPFGEGAPISVAVIQSGVTWSYAFDPAESAPHLHRHLELSEAPLAKRPQLVVWPEHAVDFYLRDASPEREALLARFAGSETALVLGAPHYERPGGVARHLNSVFLIAKGAVAARSDKTQLVPFAERSPLAWLPAWGGGWVAGAAPRVLPADAAPLGAFLCAEAMRPDVARRLARDGAELLINPSNDYWFRSEAAARLQLETASFRAIEARRWLVRATPTGLSALIDPHGAIRQVTPFGVEAVLEGEALRSRAATPFQTLGEWPQALAFGAVAVASLARLRGAPAVPR